MLAFKVIFTCVFLVIIISTKFNLVYFFSIIRAALRIFVIFTIAGF